VTFAAWSAAERYFAQGRPEFGDNVRRYYEYLREHDLTLTHALINLQRSRTVSGVFNLEQGTALSVVRETDAGIVVRGARVLATRREAHGKTQPLRHQLRHPVRDAGTEVPLPGELRPRALALRPSAGVALRGDGLRRVLRRRAGALGTRLRPGRRRPHQQHRHDDALGGAYRAPGGRE